MRLEALEWLGPAGTASAIRTIQGRTSRPPDVEPIRDQVLADGDAAVVRLTNLHDATKQGIESLKVEPEEMRDALATLDGTLRESLELAIENVRVVAEAQLDTEDRFVELPQGQTVTVRSVPVGAAGIYAPGGRASYPSSVLMGAIPARVAGVDWVALASPPGPDGRVPAEVLATAALCNVDAVYAMGGAQAVFALALGTETVESVDVIAGPGNAWVQEAKRMVFGRVGIDSYAGPSELMVVAGQEADPRPAALDLCAQAEHGEGGLLVLASTHESAIEEIGRAVVEIGEDSGIDPGAVLITVLLPDAADAIGLANALAPEHLELLDNDAAALVPEVDTAGCVFLGPTGATAFGDYVAGSNHVLPTGGAGRFAGPLGPAVFRRRISSVFIPPDAAVKLAPHVNTIARAEGFPVHAESAMIRQ